MWDALDGTALVLADEAVRVSRLCEKLLLPEAEVLDRVRSQFDFDVYRPRARWVIDNSGNLADLYLRASAIWAEVAAGVA